MTAEQYLSDLWRDLVGAYELPIETRTPEELRRLVDASEFETEVRSWIGLDVLQHTAAQGFQCCAYLVLLYAMKWCSQGCRTLDEFFAGMTARRVQGAFRYGAMGWASPERTCSWLKDWVLARLRRWEADSDSEMLLDAANGLLFIWLRQKAGLP